MNSEIAICRRAMRLQGSPGWALLLGMVVCISALQLTAAIDIPLEVEQLPTITEQSPDRSLIAFPFEESFPMTCEAKGNPEPEFRWTKNGEDFDPYLDSRLVKEENSGTFVIPNSGNLTDYEGTYRCYSFNKLGTAISEEIEFIVPHVPKFPKEKIKPRVVDEGDAVILECNPPEGIPPLQIYWMTIGLQHIEQDERVSMGLNGNLYFANAQEKDSRRDYCCYASFPRIRTIVQKTAMSVVVRSKKSNNQTSHSAAPANAIVQRKPNLLVPPSGKSEIQLVKGEELLLECIAEGFPTPKIKWAKVGHTELQKKATELNHGKLLSIPAMEEEDSGRYTCMAMNDYGKDDHHFHVTVEEPPQWKIKPESQLRMIGSEVTIKCSASGKPTPTITWSVNGLPLEEVPSLNRMVLGDTIVLKNAKASDSAVYQCEASNKHGTLLANANIMIMNFHPMILTAEALEYSAVEGRGVIMHCKVFSSPPSDISWDRDDSAVSMQGPRFTIHENGSLEIHNVEKEDMGDYTCFAKNAEGEAAIDASLKVKDPTRIVEAPKDLQILIGSAARLHCLVEYDKSFKGDFEILWEKDDMEVALNHSENSGYFVEDGTLHIINVSHRDQGVYTCVARSPVDQASASAVLMVLDVPDAPTNLVLSDHKERSVKLKWAPGDDHSSSTLEFIIEFEESHHEPGKWREITRVPGNHESAVLKLHGHLDYRFRVSGVNAVGRGGPSEPTERYKTPPAAPDRNPDHIKIEGLLPDVMNINWEPLNPIESNGPGLEYKVSYRRQDVEEEEEWQEHMTGKRHLFTVKNTPTFVPYEIKIQARNHQGWGPEPKVVTGYSGEDFPSGAPDDVAVEVMNNSVVKVNWTRVHKDKLHGHLGGYRVNWWRVRSLLDMKKSHGEKRELTVPGDRTQAMVVGLTPFSEYSLNVMTFNGRGSGPGSHPVSFKTPEGVPEKNPVFRVKDAQKHTVSLAWSPPAEPNGILTRYILEYQLINDTEEVGTLQTVEINDPTTNKWVLHDLEAVSKYKFYLRTCTRVGCGPPISEECTTTPEARLASIHGGISTQGWFIGLMCAVALLTLIVLIACFVNRNKGGKYSVKEKEDLHPDVESQGMNDDTFCEYSDNDEKPLKGSQHSLSGEIKVGDSADSLVDYGDEDGQFNEDGSFIGEYAGRKEKRVSAEIKGVGGQTTA